MKVRALLPLVAMLVLLVVAAPVEARKKPTERARIHALEKTIHRQHDQMLRMGNVIDALETKVDELMDDKNCTGLLAVDPFWFAPPVIDASTPTTVGALVESSDAENPTYWLPVMKSSCTFQDS